MNTPLLTLRRVLFAAVLLGFAPAAWCQTGPAIPSSGQQIPNQTMIGQGGGTMNDQLQYGTMGHQVMRDQSDAYRAFLKERDAAKKIEKGREFLKRYPKSPFEEQIDAGLVVTYRTQADWTNEYHYADLALALNPKDVDVLALVSWTIARVYQPTDADAAQELDKAETEAKQAIEILGTLQKPRDMTDQQFADAKALCESRAYSALGIVHFRRNDYENSAKELEQAAKSNPAPDQTDSFVLGVDRMHASQFDAAAEAFRACGQIAGPLKDPCTKNAAVAANQAAAAKSQ